MCIKLTAFSKCYIGIWEDMRPACAILILRNHQPQIQFLDIGAILQTIIPTHGFAPPPWCNGELFLQFRVTGGGDEVSKDRGLLHHWRLLNLFH